MPYSTEFDRITCIEIIGLSKEDFLKFDETAEIKEFKEQEELINEDYIPEGTR